MKIKFLVLGIALVTAILNSCDDKLTGVGSSMQPDSDKIGIALDTFQLQAYTVQVDSIYARTSEGALGEIYDPLYGNLKADFITEFYCPENFKFPREPLEGKIDSVKLRVFYARTNIGDSLAPMRAEVFPVIKSLPRYYYTNINPDQYVDRTRSLSAQTYTPYDVTVSDSIRYKITDTSDSLYYIPSIDMRLPLEFGQSFYEETVNNPASFANQQAFNEYFPGLYVTTTMGTGNIVVQATPYFYIYFKYEETLTAKDGSDSIVVRNGNVAFRSTKEVVQLNRFQNSDLAQLLEPNDEVTYIKSPSGVHTKIIIPAQEIQSVIGDRILNKMSLTLRGLPQDEWDFALSTPPGLLLLPEDSVKVFFEEGRMYDDKTSFYADYVADTRTCNFGNISPLLKAHIDNGAEGDLRLMVVPVLLETEPVYYNYSYKDVPIGVSNYLVPSGLKLRKDEEAMKIGVTSSKYKK